jgi:hypothetical protein
MPQNGSPNHIFSHKSGLVQFQVTSACTFSLRNVDIIAMMMVARIKDEGENISPLFPAVMNEKIHFLTVMGIGLNFERWFICCFLGNDCCMSTSITCVISMIYEKYGFTYAASISQVNTEKLSRGGASMRGHVKVFF